jgi:hypothetical protein
MYLTYYVNLVVIKNWLRLDMYIINYIRSMAKISVMWRIVFIIYKLRSHCRTRFNKDLWNISAGYKRSIIFGLCNRRFLLLAPPSWAQKVSRLSHPSWCGRSDVIWLRVKSITILIFSVVSFSLLWAQIVFIALLSNFLTTCPSLTARYQIK